MTPKILRPVSSWSSVGEKYAPFIASWVTPHETQIEQILSSAKEFAPSRRLPGYESWKDAGQQEKATQTVLEQAEVLSQEWAVA